VTEEPTPLRRALEHELEQTHGVERDEAAARAARMEGAVRGRFATWVRRELTLQRRDERGERRRAARERAVAGVADEQIERLSLNIRLQHGLMAISVVLLVLTGIPLKFHESGWARALIGLFGGPDVSPIVHRVGAVGLITVGLWHLAYITLFREGRWNLMHLLPRPKDAVDAFQQIKFYLGLTDERPKFDRFSYIEKFDYWAVYWGMVIMIGSGTVLWFTDFWLRWAPKWATDIAKEAHSDEALLATLAIVIWHFYNVHLNPHKFPMNKTFINGMISAREMIEEHPLEYERLMKERRSQPEHPADPRRGQS
jgi:cytochrome b subunit of formate dehydrogenase